MNQNKQAGLSFIEVLVAVVVIAIGLIGIIGLQGAAVGNTTLSSMRSTASIESGNLVARMRANTAFWKDVPTAGSGYGIGLSVDQDADPVVAVIQQPSFTVTPEEPGQRLSSAITSSKDCAAVICAKDEMAHYDLQQWILGVADTLHPNATASITYEPSPAPSPDIIRLIITWAEKSSSFTGGGTDDRSYTVSINL